MKFNYKYLIISALLIISNSNKTLSQSRTKVSFNQDWHFKLGDLPKAAESVFDDSKWRVLNLPHDWSIEGEFNEKNPASANGGALPGGIGWYRKVFKLPLTDKNKQVFIDF